MAVLKSLCIATIIGLGPGIFAQDLFNPNSLPSDWNSAPFLKKRLRALAGENAMNCGRAPQSSRVTGQPRPADVTDCALHQFAAKKKFYARYDLEGFDSEQAIGFAFDGTKLYTVTWQRTSWTNRQTIDVQECPTPIELTKTRLGRLACFSRDPNELPDLDF